MEHSLVLPAYDFALLKRVVGELVMLQSGLNGGDAFEELLGNRSFENKLPLRDPNSIFSRNPLRSKVPME